MSERYLITGVQLGLLHVTQDENKRKELINEIIDKQFLGNSEDPVEVDVKMFKWKQGHP